MKAHLIDTQPVAQGQGHLPRSKSNTKVTLIKELDVFRDISISQIQLVFFYASTAEYV